MKAYSITEEKDDEEFKFIAYANQYSSEGIKIVSFEPKKTLTKQDIDSYLKSNPQLSKQQVKEVKRLEGFLVGSDNVIAEADREMIGKFFKRRWADMSARHTETDFVERELKELESYGEEVRREYYYQIHPMIKYLKEYKTPTTVKEKANWKPTK